MRLSGIRDYFCLLLFTGMRKNEGLSLRWENIDFKEKTVTVPDTKNGKPLTIPMSSYVHDLLSARHKRTGDSRDVANILGVRPETVSRWNQGKAFPQPDKQKLLLDLEYIIDQLSDLYEPDEARLWMFSRQKLLNGKIPAELIQAGHAEKVIQMIDQLRDGVFV